MFSKLREKLKNWATGLVKKAEPIEKYEKIPKPEIEKTETITEIIEKTKTEIKPIEEHEYKEAEKREEIPEERKLGGKIWEDIKQEEKSKEKEEKKKGFFQRILSKITKVKISEKDFDVYAEELETLLLENNVALEVAEKIIKELKEKSRRFRERS